MDFDHILYGLLMMSHTGATKTTTYYIQLVMHACCWVTATILW